MNETIDKDLKGLRTVVSSGNAVLIIGTGVSLAATEDRTAGWKGFLEHGLKRLNCDDFPDFTDKLFRHYKNLLQDGTDIELINIGQAIIEHMGGRKNPFFGDWLEEVFGNLKIVNQDILVIIDKLRKGGCVIATTNYDDLLESTSGCSAITYKDHKTALKILRREKKDCILHLHGYYKEPDSIVLGRESYQQIESTDIAQNIQKLLCMIKTPIFVGSGMGLSDPNIGSLLEWYTGNIHSISTPIYILSKGDTADMFRKKWKITDGFKIIPYGTEHSELKTFLEQLLPAEAIEKVDEKPKKKEAERVDVRQVERLPETHLLNISKVHLRKMKADKINRTQELLNKQKREVAAKGFNRLKTIFVDKIRFEGADKPIGMFKGKEIVAELSSRISLWSSDYNIESSLFKDIHECLDKLKTQMAKARNPYKSVGGGSMVLGTDTYMNAIDSINELLNEIESRMKEKL